MGSAAGPEREKSGLENWICEIWMEADPLLPSESVAAAVCPTCTEPKDTDVGERTRLPTDGIAGAPQPVTETARMQTGTRARNTLCRVRDNCEADGRWDGERPRGGRDISQSLFEDRIRVTESSEGSELRAVDPSCAILTQGPGLRERELRDSPLRLPLAPHYATRGRA